MLHTFHHPLLLTNIKQPCHGPMNHLRKQKEGDATRAAIEHIQEAFQLEP
jgi:hypothetical protein